MSADITMVQTMSAFEGNADIVSRRLNVCF